MTDLLQRSVEIILSNQYQSGAYIASPNFPTYHYCWFRDGAFIAYAMDLMGETESSARFHSWVSNVLNSRADIVRRVVEKAAVAEPLSETDVLHTRYSVDGQEAKDRWPNFQLDGFGTWLWSLAEHCKMTNEAIPNEWDQAANLVSGYLSALWQNPCYDCWEEFPMGYHPYTLAAIFAGLHAHTTLGGQDHDEIKARITSFILENAISNGCFSKFIGAQTVDANLLGLSVPYNLVSPNDPRMVSTVKRIESTLRNGGGVHRYSFDTYYGGGEWIILSAWLGWYYAQLGEDDKAEEILYWIEAQADTNDQLPEQVSKTLNAPVYLEYWQRLWGNVANPLLWSHAMYIILHNAIRERH